MAGSPDRGRLRVLALLAAGPARIAAAAGPAMLRLESLRGAVGVSRAEFDALARDGLLHRAGGEAAITPEGRALLERRRAGERGFLAQHAEIAEIELGPPGSDRRIAVNLSESPLAQLARRRGRGAEPFLSEEEFDAGERLRRDHAAGMLMPRVTASWDTAVAVRRRGGLPGGSVELTDAALAARRRVDAAIAAVGPDLSGVLVDVCCFLKGLETVERERGWPARSAKVMLKAALGALARHYAPPARRPAAPLHWGSADYRPAIRRP